MAPRTVDMSVIIVAYTEERWEQLVALIESLTGQTVPPRELILVIDHNPRLLERVRGRYPRVHIIENRGERGTAGARNAGIAAATGAYLVFFDDDVVVAPDWIERIGEDLEDPQVLGVRGAALPTWQHERPRWFPEEFDWVIGCSYRGMPLQATPVRNPWGYNMCVRREVFDMVGWFEEKLWRVRNHPGGCEETELCVRALQQWPTRVFLYDPAAVVRHFVPASRERWSYFRSHCFYGGRSKALLVQLHGDSYGLDAERTYMTRVLQRGITRGVADALVHQDLTGLARAVAIAIGLWLTVIGYMAGRLSGFSFDEAAATVPSGASRTSERG